MINGNIPPCNNDRWIKTNKPKYIGGVHKLTGRNLLPCNNSQMNSPTEQKKNAAGWVEISPEWAYWVVSESFNFKRVKKRVPIDSIIIIKSREKADDERTYVDSSFGQVIETRIVKLTKKEASEILAKQFIELTRWTNQWPPFTSFKSILKSGDVQVSYDPTEYDSFILSITRQILGTDPEEFLKKLKKPESSQVPPWRIETAKSGRSKCRSCNDVILEGRFRIGEPYFYEGNYSYKWYHPRCMTKRMDVDELETLDGYKILRAEEKLRLKRILTQ